MWQRGKEMFLYMNLVKWIKPKQAWKSDFGYDAQDITRHTICIDIVAKLGFK